MPKSRVRKRKPEKRTKKETWWGRNWRYVDSGVTHGCLPLVGIAFALPLATVLL